MAMDEEAGGLDVELLSNVFADLDQIAATLAAGAGLRFVQVLDARQMLGQRLTAGTGTRGFREPRTTRPATFPAPWPRASRPARARSVSNEKEAAAGS